MAFRQANSAGSTLNVLNLAVRSCNTRRSDSAVPYFKTIERLSYYFLEIINLILSLE